jgi:hypothetical protein
MANTRRNFMQQFVAGAGGVLAGSRRSPAFVAAVPVNGPDPLFEKIEPGNMAELGRLSSKAVTVTEVKDYTTCHYTGTLAPSPPHADMNPKRAFVVTWKNHPCRFVFGHEASYCPILELPSGAAMCDQFFEGNLGEAELFNNLGRKEKNSFVDVIQSGPERAWLRWTYFAVNKDDDTQPRLRGTEDYFAYPNGLTLRRLTYTSLMPDKVVGYSTQPVELFGVLPQGGTIKDLFARDPVHGDFNVLSIADLYADRRYDICWDEKGGVRRNGDDATLAAITNSPGCALIIPFQERSLFAVLGTASGFSPKYNQFVDHSTPGAVGGAGWGQGLWDHWPIGWLNSQGHDWKPGSPYAYHFGSIGQFFVPEGKRIKSFSKDYPEYCKDMQFNRWTEKHIAYVMLGSATSWSEIHRMGREWLDQGAGCAQPESVGRIQNDVA